MKLDSVGAKNAVDIFAAKHHSFYINKEGDAFAWGLNNHGQLGIGNLETNMIPIPTPIKFEKGLKIHALAGGEHHSIALTQAG